MGVSLFGKRSWTVDLELIFFLMPLSPRGSLCPTIIPAPGAGGRDRLGKLSFEWTKSIDLHLYLGVPSPSTSSLTLPPFPHPSFSPTSCFQFSLSPQVSAQFLGFSLPHWTLRAESRRILMNLTQARRPWSGTSLERDEPVSLSSFTLGTKRGQLPATPWRPFSARR